MKKTKQIYENGDKSRSKILLFIENYIKINGFSPAIREIALGVELKSTSVIFYHLSRLRLDGLITFQDNKTRTIRVVNQEVLS